MKVHKTRIDLLEDLFSFFKEKYGADKEYEAYKYAHDKCRVCNLIVLDCPTWARPALILKKWGTSKQEMELRLTLSAPSPGHNEEITGVILTIHASKGEGNNLYITADDHIGGGFHGKTLTKKTMVTNKLRSEIEEKTQELFNSGAYDFIPQPKANVSLM
jgi:hypothetical protein